MLVYHKPEDEFEKRSPENVAQSKRLPSPPATMSAAGKASSTVLRFFSFIGAGVICTKAINMYLEHERKQEAAAAAEAAAPSAVDSSTAVMVAADASPARTVAAAAKR